MTDRLDDETERLINDLIGGVSRDAEKVMGYNYRPAHDALRSRIAELQRQAFEDGRASQ